MKTHYDIIIAGFGAAGGQLLHQLIRHNVVPTLSVLVIDKVAKRNNDRTWCFWEQGEGLYDSLLTHSWRDMAFALEGSQTVKSSAGWRYKQIEADRFYHHIRALADSSGTEFICAEIYSHHETNETVEIKTSEGTLTASYYFSSIADFANLKKNYTGKWLHQHFVGWFVKTEKKVFDPQVATLMDFDTTKRRTEFMYLLPDTENTALVENTLFSSEILTTETYEASIRTYLEKLDCGSYHVERKEQGIIPMTDYPFQRMNSRRVVMIGSAGGWTRASTGYTFRNSGILAERVAIYMKTGKMDVTKLLHQGRSRFYDRVMLDLLERRNDLGPKFLFQVYEKNPLDRVLKFLDGTTSFIEEIKIVLHSTPRMELLRSVARVTFKNEKRIHQEQN